MTYLITPRKFHGTWRRSVAALVGLGLVIAACGGDDDEDPAPVATTGAESTVGQADDAPAASGRIVVYATTLPKVQERLVSAFTAETGIEVESLRLSSAPLAQRFVEEQDAGLSVADVFTVNDVPVYQDLVAKGVLADMSGYEGFAEWPEDARVDAHFVEISRWTRTICYNTDLVTEPIADWGDLLRPELAGQIVMADPENNPQLASTLYAVWEQAEGADFLSKLGAQGVTYVSNVPAAVEAVAAGEYAVAAYCNFADALRFAAEGAPIQPATPSPSPTGSLVFYVSVPLNAPNPDAAQKWVEFLLSDEGQEIYNEGVGISPLGEIPGSLARPELADIDPDEAFANYDRYLDELGR